MSDARVEYPPLRRARRDDPRPRPPARRPRPVQTPRRPRPRRPL